MDALALSVGVSPRLVQKWQQGAVQPRFENLVKLAEALGQETAWFFVRHESTEAAA